MAKPTVEIGQEVRVISGGLERAEGVVLDIQRSPHGAGLRSHICELKLTKSPRFDYSIGQNVKLWASKLEPLHGPGDPNYLFRKLKEDKLPPWNGILPGFVFRCGSCGWRSTNSEHCPNCVRTRTCSECGSDASFETKYGTCVDCGEPYKG